MRAFLFLLLLAGPLVAAEPTVRFRRAAEPRENAFSLLIPIDWRISGGITRVNPTAAGGALNATGAKLDLTIENPSGSVRLRWYPEINYMDMRRSTAGQTGMFPAGSNYNGAPVFPLPPAVQYLEAGLRRDQPRASGIQISGRYPLPQAAASYYYCVINEARHKEGTKAVGMTNAAQS
jgi:hypothetical protein